MKTVCNTHELQVDVHDYNVYIYPRNQDESEPLFVEGHNLETLIHALIAGIPRLLPSGCCCTARKTIRTIRQWQLFK